MIKRFKPLMIAAITLMFAACQSTSLDSQKIANKSYPGQISAESDIGKTFLWGGEILQVKNLPTTTELTILSYPLDRNEKPKANNDSVGRFIAVYPGFLEPTDYRQGKLVSTLGTLTDFREGKVAQADYNFPVLNVEKLDLKGVPQKGYRLPFSIGIGIGIHN